MGHLGRLRRLEQSQPRQGDRRQEMMQGPLRAHGELDF